MATPKKARTPKKTKETKKQPSTKTSINNKTSTKNNNSKNNRSKTSNGTVSDSDAVKISSPDPKSQKERKQNGGGEITKTPPSVKSQKGKQKRKQKQEPEQEEEVEDVKSYRFPMDRVKRIIRSEDSDLRISNDAVFLVNKATEKFLEKFCEEARACCVQDRKKSLAYKHLSSVVRKRKRYDFLSDFVPEQVKAEDALAKRKLAEAKAG